MALVVSSYLPGESPFTSSHPVHPILCDEPLDYGDGLIEAWNTEETLVLVEHDMEFSDELVAGLLSCDRALCAYPYMIWSKRDFWHYAQAVGANQRLTKGQDFAHHSSIGFCKITREARVRPMLRLWWKFVEHSVHHGLGGRITETDAHHIFDGVSDPSQVLSIEPPATGPWHIHWPAVAHHHDYPLAGPMPLEMAAKGTS